MSLSPHTYDVAEGEAPPGSCAAGSKPEIEKAHGEAKRFDRVKSKPRVADDDVPEAGATKLEAHPTDNRTDPNLLRGRPMDDVGSLAHEPGQEEIEVATPEQTLKQFLIQNQWWFIGFAVLAALLGATIYWRNTDLLIRPQKLSVVDEFIQLTRERVNIAMSVAIVTGPGSNFTLIRSMHSLNLATEDLLNQMEHFQHALRKSGGRLRYGDSADCLAPVWSTSSNDLSTGVMQQIQDLNRIHDDVSADLQHSIGKVTPSLLAQAASELDKLEETKYEHVVDEIITEDTSAPSSEELMQDANTTALEVLEIIQTSITQAQRYAEKDCEGLGALLYHIESVITAIKTLVERYKKCVLPATYNLQYVASRARDSTDNYWEDLEDMIFTSKTQHPNENALSLLNIGLLQHLACIERMAASLGEQNRQCGGSSVGVVTRYGVLHAHTSRLLSPSSQNVRGLPWIDGKVGAHWWMPAPSDVHALLVGLDEDLSSDVENLTRTVNQTIHWNAQWAFKEAKQEQKIWKGDPADSDEDANGDWEPPTFKDRWDRFNRWIAQIIRHVPGSSQSTRETRLYHLIGISPTATEQEVHKACRRLVQKHHPDKNPGDSNASKYYTDIVYACEVLRDSERRRLYDEYGEEYLGFGSKD
jgi:hypothetical protein